MAPLVNAPNRVLEQQKFYHEAYNKHTRLWRIHPRSAFMYIPFVYAMWGTTATCMWMMGRKVLGYNSIWGPK